MIDLNIQIEQYRQRNNMSYIDAVVSFSDKFNICVYDLSEQLHDNIKKAILFEAKELKLMKDNDDISSLKAFFK